MQRIISLVFVTMLLAGVVFAESNQQTINQIVIKLENGSLETVETLKDNERVYIAIDDVEKLFSVDFDQTDIKNMYRLRGFQGENLQTEKNEAIGDAFYQEINGVLYYDDGRVYSGKIENGIPVGVGVMLYGDGTVYEGEFDKGFPNGEGHYIFIDGRDYRGAVVYGTITGFGRMRYLDRSVYKGYFYFGLYNGAGRYTEYKGGVKQGYWDMGVYEHYLSDEELKSYFAD